MECADVLEPEGFGHGPSYPHLLADAVDEEEVTLGEEDRQRDAREATARTEVDDPRTRLEADHLGDTERMQDMVFVERVNILARDDVDLGVPLSI